MKLLRYLINEEENLDLSIIEKNCSSFLKEMKAGVNCFIRMSFKDLSKKKSDIIKVSYRNDRRPKDTPREISIEVDNLLKERFGWKPRSQGLFTWITKRKEARLDAADIQRIIFPANNYKYVYSPIVHDLYDTINFFGGDIEDYIEEHFKDNILETYTDKGAMKTSFTNECMISAPAYYAVSTKLIPELKKRFSF